MTQNHHENLDKATQTGELFREDLLELYKGTTTIAEELVISEMLDKVTVLHRNLVRLNEEAKKRFELLKSAL